MGKVKKHLVYITGPIILIITLSYSFISILLIGSFLNPLFDKIDVSAKYNSIFIFTLIRINTEVLPVVVDGSSKISDENVGGSDSPISESINAIKEK